MIRYSALLMVGPTGAGKTPLGAYCEKMGLWRAKVFHFDFGAILRGIAAARTETAYLTDQDIVVIRQSLRTGALLENRNFHIALKILLSYAAERQIRKSDLILLNGLPRHQGQALDIAPYVRVKLVLELSASPDIVQERIRRNTGGDRVRRKDDPADAVAKKLEIFSRQTEPLLSHYRRKDIPILSLPIEIDTSPAQVYRALINHPVSAHAAMLGWPTA